MRSSARQATLAPASGHNEARWQTEPMRPGVCSRVFFAFAIATLAPAQIIDYHQHLYSPFAGPISISGWKGVTADELISLMDAANIRRAVVLSTAYSLANPHKPAIPNEREAVGKDNDWISAQVAKYPERLIGFCSVNPLRSYAVRACCGDSRAFVCFHLAPSLGLPPLPPGVPVSDVQPRQLWWLWAVLSTAAGLWLFTGRTRRRRIVGALVVAMPHLIGAPAGAGDSAVPAELMRNFTIASLTAVAIFWTVLGGIGGFLAARSEH